MKRGCEWGADWLDRLGTRRLRLSMRVSLDERTSWLVWFHHPPVVPVLEWPGLLTWRIFLPLDVNVKGWTAADSVSG